MYNIRLTKIFYFEMSHALWNYDGLCRNIHGHSYQLHVTVSGKPETNNESSKLGMVMDFGDLKKIVKQEILDVYDHSLIINEISEHRNLLLTPQMTQRLIVAPYQPTAENLIVVFAKKINQLLPSHVKLHSLKLYETSTAFVEWFAQDNPDTY